ncbi:MAG: hypothetical protein IJ451_00175 [Ruminococcus sp.]|nr:hypothetical protein [Ruminococcus sp.]
MDILLINGDIGVTNCGDYLFAKGIEEALEKALMCAKIKKGSFIYNKALGTTLGSIDCDSVSARKTATTLINEVLINTAGYVAEVENIEKTADGKISLLIAVSGNEETRRGQVIVNADL